MIVKSGIFLNVLVKVFMRRVEMRGNRVGVTIWDLGNVADNEANYIVIGFLKLL